MNIKEKIIIVTGASSGIGLAVSKLLTQKGAKVALVSRSTHKLNTISKILPGSVAITADMTEKKDIIRMVKYVKKSFGRIDVLINNAGQGYDASIESIEIKTFRKIFELNLLAPLIAMQQVIPIMKQQKEGVIINISSGTALMHLPHMAAYSSMKRALVGISLTAREELKKEHISVGVVYPYITETDFEKNTIKSSKDMKISENNNEFKLPKADSANYVAAKIWEAIATKKAETFAHDWMGE